MSKASDEHNKVATSPWWARAESLALCMWSDCIHTVFIYKTFRTLLHAILLLHDFHLSSLQSSYHHCKVTFLLIMSLFFTKLHHLFLLILSHTWLTLQSCLHSQYLWLKSQFPTIVCLLAHSTISFHIFFRAFLRIISRFREWMGFIVRSRHNRSFTNMSVVDGEGNCAVPKVNHRLP